jgi:hypothetical protein
MQGFGISGVEPSGSDTKWFVGHPALFAILLTHAF